MALLIALTFHLLVRDPLNDCLPDYLRSRLAARWSFPFAAQLKTRWPVFAISALLGAASHIGWDSLTHNGWAAANLAFYHAWSVRVGDLDYPPFFVLQQISSVLGTAFLLFYVLMLPSLPAKYAEDKTINRVWWFWPLMLTTASAIMGLRIDWNVPFNADRHLGDLVYAAVGACLAGLITASALVRIRIH